LAPTIYRLTSSDYPSKVVIQLHEPNERILEITTNRVYDQFNKNYIFIKIIKDKTREEQLLKQKTDFITIAAHQLRTPITGIA